MTLTPVNAGWIEVICGSMFSGKTEELIRRLRRVQIAQMSIAIFKPKIDSRFSEGHIVSHNRIKMESHIIDEPNNILNIVKESLKSTTSDTFDVNDILLVPLKEARENFEKEYLTTQLKKFGGNISKTAKFVGMERSALHRKLKILGVKELN